MIRLLIAFYIVLLLVIGAVGQDQRAKGNEPQIPQLREMHNFIHPMWHKGYPNKDIALLKSLYPDLSAQYQELQNAAFPPEWVDKKLHWESGLKGMEHTLQAYKTAMDDNDETALLEAAKILHDDYEGLVRIVYPPFPEIDDFHKTLYHVYHDYLPNGNWEMVKASIPEFQRKMDAIRKMALPKWMSKEQESFDASRQALDAAVQQLAAVKDSEDSAQLSQAVEKVHDAYEGLQSVCMD